MKQDVNLFVAGGCHIIGAEVGMENSFVCHVLTSLKQDGREAQATLFPYALLNNPDAILEECRISQPDLVILQIGNYESTPPSFKKLMRKRFGIGNKRISKTRGPKLAVVHISTRIERADEPVDAAFANRQYVHKRTCKQSVKRVADYLLGHPYVDFKQQEAAFMQFLRRLREQYNGPVLVFGPFPAADPFITTYRRLLSDRFAAHAPAFDVEFIDVCRTFSQQLMPGAGFVDRMHLNVASHTMLGGLVSEWALESIPQSNELPPVQASPELVLRT